MENNKWLKTYGIIWVGQFISMLTSYAVSFAVIIWLSIEMNSAEILAYAGIASFLPQVIVGPFAGVFIDRWNRKKVMIFADLFIALCTLVMVFVFAMGEMKLIWIYLLLVCRSLGSAFHSPAMQAVAPLIVPEKHLLRVSGINQMLQSVSSIAGPAVGTLAFTYLPINQVLYLDVFGAIVAIITLLMVTIPSIRVEEKLATIQSVLSDLKDGFNTIYENKGLRSLFFYSMLATFFIMPIAIMFPLLTINHYQGDKWEISIIEIVWGVGMFVGGSLLGIFKIKTPKIILINCTYIILGITFVISGILPLHLFIGFVIATIIGGISMSIFSAAFMTTLQEEVKPELLGRVFSLYFSIALLPSVIGLMSTGFVAEAIGVTNLFWIAGCFVIAVGIISFFTPSVMRLGKKIV